MVGPGRCTNTTPGPNPQPNPKPRPPSRREMRAVNSLTECRKTQSRHADVLSESDDLQARLADLADATGDPRLRQLGQDISAICWELAERGEGDAALAALVDRFPGVAAAAGQRERPWLDPRVDGDFWDDGHL